MPKLTHQQKLILFFACGVLVGALNVSMGIGMIITLAIINYLNK